MRIRALPPLALALVAATALAQPVMFTRFKLPGTGLYEQTSTTRVTGGREMRDVTRLCAKLTSPANLPKGLPAEIAAQCSSRVLEDSPARARPITDSGAAGTTETTMESTGPASMRTTIVMRTGGREHTRSVVESRRLSATCPAEMAKPASAATTGPSAAMPRMPAADPATCAKGATEIARLRADANVPADVRSQLVGAMQTSLRMQGCRL
jgi:hypothetical protein